MSIIKKPNRNIIEAAIIEAKGNILVAAQTLSVTRNTLYDWIKRDDLHDIVQQGRDSMIDFAESMLQKNIANEKEASIIFFLKTQGRNRGYAEKVDIEHTGKDGGPIQFGVKKMTDDELQRIINTKGISASGNGSKEVD